MDSSVGITMLGEYKTKMPFGDTSSYLLIPPGDNAYIYYGFGWRWTRKDEADFYPYLKKNTKVLDDSLNLYNPRIMTRRQGLIGKGLVVRVK